MELFEKTLLILLITFIYIYHIGTLDPVLLVFLTVIILIFSANMLHLLLRCNTYRNQCMNGCSTAGTQTFLL